MLLMLIIEVLVHPDSRLVPPGIEFTLTCQIRTTHYTYWIVNGTEANSNYHHELLLKSGFSMERDNSQNGVTTLILRVNSSFSHINNTRAFCTSVVVDSMTATIQILTGITVCVIVVLSILA